MCIAILTRQDCMKPAVQLVQPFAAVKPRIAELTYDPGHGTMCSAQGSQNRHKKPSGDTDTPGEVKTVTASKPNRNDNVTYFCERDFYVQIKTRTCLHDSCFYYEGMSSAEAKSVLKHCSVGIFLIRDSSDPNHLYTISVRTRRGPTSIRVLYECGRFCLDADEKSRGTMPLFASLMELIDYYVRLTAGKIDQCRFLDRSGRKDLPIILDKPRLTKAPDLKSICRTTINRHLPAKNPVEVRQRIDDLPLPKPLRSFLKDHPFIV